MNKKLALILLTILLPLSFSSQADDLSKADLAKLPDSARKIVDRHLICLELIRTTREPGTDHDKLIQDQILKFNCSKSYESIQAMKRKYRKQPEILRILQKL